MTHIRPLARLSAMAGIIALAGTFAGVAHAGPAEVALLKSYEGNWKGAGKLQGTSNDVVTCRMSLTDGNDDKVNYSGRCLIEGANLSIAGTLAYIDANQRYEGAMTSNVNFSGVAIGVKQGNGIVFNLKSRGTASDKTTYDIQAGITLLPGTITVDFKATDVASGQAAIAKIPFAKL